MADDLSCVDLDIPLADAPKYFTWQICAAERATAVAFVWAARAASSGSVSAANSLPSLPPELLSAILNMYPRRTMICSSTLRFATPSTPLMRCACHGLDSCSLVPPPRPLVYAFTSITLHVQPSLDPFPTELGTSSSGLMAHSPTDSAAQTLVHSSVYGALPWHAFMHSAIYVEA